MKGLSIKNIIFTTNKNTRYLTYHLWYSLELFFTWNTFYLNRKNHSEIIYMDLSRMLYLTAFCLCSPPGSSKNETRSLAPLLCSTFKWFWKSSVRWLGSPPGKEAQIGQTTSWLTSLCWLDTCSWKNKYYFRFVISLGAIKWG